MKKLFISIILKILTFYFRIVNYIKLTNGEVLINPSDVMVDTSLIWKGEMAPAGKVFYIAKYRGHGMFYSKNVEINRKDLPPIKESMIKYRIQRIFANTITERLNGKV